MLCGDINNRRGDITLELDIELHLQVWKELKPHLIGGDIQSAADDFIHVLLEHGADANEIMTFAVDSDIKVALHGIADEEHFEEEFDHDVHDDEWTGYENGVGC